MKVEILAKGYNVSDKFEDVLTKKLEKLDRLFDASTKAKAVCKKDKLTYVLELTINAPGTTFRAESKNLEDMYQNIDTVMSKIARQYRHDKTKNTEKIVNDFAKDAETQKWLPDPSEQIPIIVKRKSFDLTPLTIDEAIKKLDQIDHNFYVFLDANTGNVNVLYKRLDGDLGVIETKT